MFCVGPLGLLALVSPFPLKLKTPDFWMSLLLGIPANLPSPFKRDLFGLHSSLLVAINGLHLFLLSDFLHRAYPKIKQNIFLDFNIILSMFFLPTPQVYVLFLYRQINFYQRIFLTKIYPLITIGVAFLVVFLFDQHEIQIPSFLFSLLFYLIWLRFKMKSKAKTIVFIAFIFSTYSGLQNETFSFLAIILGYFIIRAYKLLYKSHLFFYLITLLFGWTNLRDLYFKKIIQVTHVLNDLTFLDKTNFPFFSSFIFLIILITGKKRWGLLLILFSSSLVECPTYLALKQ